MRLKPFAWLVLSMLCFAAAFYFWQWGERMAAQRGVAPAAATAPAVPSPGPAAAPGANHSARFRTAGEPFAVLTRAGTLNLPPVPVSTNRANPRVAYRLSNTPKSYHQLLHSDQAILLENALLDTTQPADLQMPGFLKAEGDPGSYIVQSRTALDNNFRRLLREAGATIVSTIPNNAYLVRASADVAQQLRASRLTQAVLPYEPYYKLKGTLLRGTLEQLPGNVPLNLVLFADGRESLLAELGRRGVEVLSEDRSPFGPVFTVQAREVAPWDFPAFVAELAGRTEVQVLEVATARQPANDMSRTNLGVAAIVAAPTNYWGLTGTNVLININDTGVDTNHPDLAGRIYYDVPFAGIDSNGHGTHVAGTIAGSGLMSSTVSNKFVGSVVPVAANQFRGMAFQAKLLSMLYSYPDFYLQQRAASSNALISNNSWNYGAAEYDIAAASYDAAVRDSLPMASGSTPLVYVFSAGNSGSGDYDGGSGNPDSILSPATAKNVITVGGLEMPRHITNETYRCSACTNDPTTCVTNRPWAMGTDASDQVAGYSSRGNVGIGIEGEYGRFKPDVVAPGTFVISTRSTHWDEVSYYNRTSHTYTVYTNLVVTSNSLWKDQFFIPCNAVQVDIDVYPNRTSPSPFPGMPIYVRQDALATNTSDIKGTNHVTMPGDAPLSPVGVDWHYSIGNPTTQSVSFNVSVDITLTNQLGNYYEVLSNLNNSLTISDVTNTASGSNFYRFESGTSLAAAGVSGTLGLMQEFFQQRLHVTNSPAMMKALLINGARPVGGRGLYDFQVNTPINLQGWGLVNLPTTLQPAMSNLVTTPAGPSSVYLFDQNPTNALATGQRRTWFVQPDDVGLGQDLRVTLVWTDPPGNPVAGVKLVNDLDLIVTNLESGEVFFGNDIAAGADVNTPWDPSDTNSTHVPVPDVVNNVENVYLHPSFYGPLGSNYSITVVGRRVNANAVSANPDNVVQDYALVISSGDGDWPTALSMRTLTPPVSSTNLPLVTAIINMFTNSPDDKGGILLGQHVGASSPLLGTNQVPVGTADGRVTLGVTNQWHFYVLTNDTDWTNAAFLTFLPPTLSVPRMGATNEGNPDNASRPEADIDLYVSKNSGLTNLDPAVLSDLTTTYRSLSRMGSETIVLSNSTPGVYYIGVKCEDQQAAEYGILAILSRLPFGMTDELGNQTLRGFPVPTLIPDGTPERPGGAYVFAVSVMPTMLHRVVATNVLSHQLVGDLIGTVTHGSYYATLNNHTTNEVVNNQVYVYDDSDERNVRDLQGNPAHKSDGPGSLRNFAGREGVGQWLLTQVDNAAGFVGQEDRLTLWLEKQQDLTGGVTNTIEAGACREDFVEVPFQATNLTISVTPLEGQGPISIQVCPLDGGGSGCKGTLITNMTPGLPVTVSIDIYDEPPLMPGVYSVRQCNLGPDRAKIYLKAFIYLNSASMQVTVPASGGPTRILDDAVTYSSIFFSNHMRVADIDIGVLLQDYRASDLALTLVSPSGTRVLLYQNRGGSLTNGLGSFSSETNSLGGSVFGYTNLVPFYTNDFDAAAVGWYAPGARFQGWRVVSNLVSVFPDYTIPWYTNNYLLLADGMVSNTLPTSNSLNYQLSFKATHAPYLVGTVGWWPLDGDGRDIFSGLDGVLYGDVIFSTGRVSQAFYGDGSGTRLMVPRCPEVDVGKSAHGFSIEGWILPPAGPAGYDVVADFATNSNPNGVWSYAWSDGLLGAQTLFPRASHPTINGGSEVGWDDPYNSQGFTPSVARVIQAYNNGNATFDAGALLLHPCGSFGTAYAHAVWTAPRAGNYAVDCRFYAQQNGVFTDVGVVMRGGVVYTNVITQNGTSRRFTQTISVGVGDTVDFAVGPNGMFNVHPGNIGLEATITPLDLSVTNRPIASWNDPTNASPRGVQLALGGARGGLSTLTANLWDTNAQPHAVSATNAIRGGLWQHVALTYDAAIKAVRLYTNGQLAQVQIINEANFVPRTYGDFYLGFDPAPPVPGAGFVGGLDEFGLYERALTDCEVARIYQAGARGKYGTNVLTCPVTMEMALFNNGVKTSYFFTNAIIATNQIWQTNILNFSYPVLAATTNGAGTNLTGMVLVPQDPNVAVDEFVLSAVLTNSVGGLLHFTENTNLALLPIKFAPTPYSVTSFPPTLIFSNDFERARLGAYPAGSVLAGYSNAAFGQRDWTNILGTASVISNLLVDTAGSNWVALSTGALETSLPTTPGRRYLLTYAVRGPCAVGWWNGAQSWLDHRALDLVGDNDGAFYYFATNATETNFAVNVDNRSAYVGNQGLFFAGMISNGVSFNPDLASKIELGDPDNLKFTNGFTIEGWIKPIRQTNDYIQSLLNFLPTNKLVVEQIFWRGDLRDCRDPYYLALVQMSPTTWDLRFHIEGQTNTDCGVLLETANQPIQADKWQHVAAVFDDHVRWTNNPPWPTNQMRLYLDGVLLTNVYLKEPAGITNLIQNTYTGRAPFRDLDPGYSPGVAIGNHGRSDASQPFRGYMDELTVYARALTDAEIGAIARAGTDGKADTSVPPRQSLAKVAVALDGVRLSTGVGDNAEWTTYPVAFTAARTNTILQLRGLLPGTLVDRITLTELPMELSYLPEESLEAILGEDAYGEWRLEIWDGRAGGDTNALLVNWQLHFTLLPTNPPPIINLAHGIPYTNSLVAHGSQNFVVEVPQWALYATNVLVEAVNRATTNPAPVGVWCDTNGFPTSTTNALFWPPVYARSANTLSTNLATSTWPLVPGNTYYLTVTNTNAFAVRFSVGVWFDITSLTNCQLISSAVGPALSSTNYSTNYVGPAGIARYFQFEVPADDTPADMTAKTVVFWLGAANTNLTMVLSQSLPLPDLTHYDYMSRRASTNDEILMVVTNSTPVLLQSNRWYVGVFNTDVTNVPFHLQACVITNNPAIIRLTNAIPYTASLSAGLNTNYLAPPGPPRWFFFKFEVTNTFGSGMLFELFNVTPGADLDLVLQRDVLPTQAPFFDSSFSPVAPIYAGIQRVDEEIIVRPSPELADLRGNWYLGIYNNETNKVSYSIQATLSTNIDGVSFMLRGQTPSPYPDLTANGTFLRWNSVPGENYVVQFATNIVRPVLWTKVATVSASTPISTYEFLTRPAGPMAFYRTPQVPTPYPPLPAVTVQAITPPNPAVQVRVSWPSTYPNPPYLLQYAVGQTEVWYDYTGIVNLVGTNYVTIDNIRSEPTFYRLFPGP